MKKYKIAFHTLGCKTNHYETDAIANQFIMHGYERVAFQEKADAYIINTCTVTGEADRKSRQMLRRASQKNPQAIVVAMGCHAELSDTSKYADLCIGTQGKSQAVAMITKALKAGKSTNINFVQENEDNDKHSYDVLTEYEELGISEKQSETRAYLKIEDGCNAFCSYCAIPLARGRVRSRERDQIITEARSLVKAGYKEIVLTGIHLCSYGFERGEPEYAVASLAYDLSNIEGLKRIRLGSLEPLSVTDKFLEIINKSDKICPHFHLSLQSGSDRILKLMNRRYDTEQFRAVVNNIRCIWPEAGITTDLITAFPGESQTDFDQTLDFCREMQFSRMHIFQYSARAGTPAASMPDRISPHISSARSKKMQNLADEMALSFHKSQIGKNTLVLTEQQRDDDKITGYTESYIPVLIDNTDDKIKINDIVRVKIVSADKDYMYAHAIKP